MGRLLLVARLAAKDVLRRPGEAVMLVVVIVAATAALTLGLVLHGATAHPYATTKAETAGPDAIATYFVSHGGPAASAAARKKVAPIAHAKGVVVATGPLPVAFPVLQANGHADAVLAEGRSTGRAAVDQPKLTAGSWVRPGGIVLERSFADALGARVGQRVDLGGRPFAVAGIAVSAALPNNGLGFLMGSARWPNPGLAWVTTSDAESLASVQYPLSWVLGVRLAHPGSAEAFADRFDPGGYTNNNGALYVIPWEMIARQDAMLTAKEQKILEVGSSLLALLAIASLAIVVGGRMAEQHRRVGLLKAMGSTPGVVAAILWAEYLAVAIVAAAVGLAVGRLAAPLLTSPGAGLLGTAGAPELSVTTVSLVLALAVAVATLATLVPALRAARTSTVAALTDTARQPRRQGRLVAWSARLPVPWLLAARIVARRPRRFVLGAASIAVTVSGIVAVLFAHASVAAGQFGRTANRPNFDRSDVGFISQTARIDSVLTVVSVMLVVLAVANVVFIVRSTIQDNRHSSAITRALGATPEQLSASLSLAQLAPSVAGALLGVAGGYGMFLVANGGGSITFPPIWTLLVAFAVSVVAVAGITAVPARFGGRIPVVEVLRSDG